MEFPDLSAITLKEDDILIKRLPDYYEKSKGLNTTIKQDITYNVGVVVSVGWKAIAMTMPNNIIYYHKNIGTELNIKGIGEYDLINKESMLISRDDEDVNDY